MIVRSDVCPKCGNQVTVILPELFPNLTAKALEKYKRISLTPISHYCRNCAKDKEEQ